MTATHEATIAELQRTVAELRRGLAERDAALAQRNNEYSERIEQQSAIIDVLKVMSASPGDPQPVFELIVQQARALCDSTNAALFEYDGTLVHCRAMVSGASSRDQVDVYIRQFPMPLRRDSDVGVVMAIQGQCTIHVRDSDIDHRVSRAARDLGVRSVINLPLIQDDRATGCIVLANYQVGGFSDSQVDLLQTFAEQAVIAMRSAETYRALQTRTADLQESLQYQTATSDVLKVISRSAYDLTTVLQALLDTAARLCGADFGALITRAGDAFRTSAIIPLSPEHEAFVRRKIFIPSPHGSVVERTAFARQITHIEDIALLSDYVTSGRGFVVSGTALGVPLILEGDVVGIFTLHRQRVERFTESQIELVSTFADQAVIAIENTRLIAEQREALEQQTATAEVLQVINASPGNLKPVFDAMLEKGMRLCGAAFGILRRYDGGQLHTLATLGVPVAYAEYMARNVAAPGPGTSIAGAVETGQPTQVLNMLEGSGYRNGQPGALAIADLGGARTVLHVPLIKDRVSIGLFTLYRQEVHAFSDKQIALMENFAAQAVIAMENARLINEQREALEQQTATAEVLQVINASPGDLAPVFDAILEKGINLCEAAFGILGTFDGQLFHLAATRGLTPEMADSIRPPFSPTPGQPTGRMRDGEDIVHVLDTRDEVGYRAGQGPSRALVDQVGARSALFVALRRNTNFLGNLVIFRREVRAFSDKEIALVRNFAAQAVIAMENARLINEQREALEQQTATAEVLQVINASPGNLTPVFDAVLEKAMQLCQAAFGCLYTYDGERFPIAAVRGLPGALAELIEKQGSLVPTHGGKLERVLATKNAVQILDLAADAMYRSGDPDVCAHVDLGGVRTIIDIPLLKDDSVVGLVAIYRQEVRAFSGYSLRVFGQAGSIGKMLESLNSVPDA